MDGSAAGRRQAADKRAFADEVLMPFLITEIEKGYDRAGLGIDTGKVWTLVEIAAVTGQSEIGLDRWTAMLTCDDVLGVEAEIGIGLLMNLAIFATIAGPLSDEIAKCRIHASRKLSGRVRRQQSAGPGLQDSDYAGGSDESFVFILFFRCQRPFVAALRQVIDFPLVQWIGAEIDKLFRKVRCHTHLVYSARLSMYGQAHTVLITVGVNVR